jgi:DNA adenine methylase
LIRAYYPRQIGRYFEPFLGSGAVFFDLTGSGLLEGGTAHLSDCNADLIGFYEAVRDQPAAVSAELRGLAESHARTPGFYYEVRDQRFNPARAQGVPPATPSLAAMFFYLNRTGFNGLYRVNRQGGFNVPEGRYASPQIWDDARIMEASRTLRRPGVSLSVAPFEAQIDQAGPGDFIYGDPPYAPLSPTSNFAHYTAAGFGEADQRRLQQALFRASRRGASVVVSNSSAPLILDLFSGEEAADAGLVLTKVPARRAINANAGSRGAVDEVLVVSRSLRLDGVRATRPPVATGERRRA